MSWIKRVCASYACWTREDQDKAVKTSYTPYCDADLSQGISRSLPVLWTQEDLEPAISLFRAWAHAPRVTHVVPTQTSLKSPCDKIRSLSIISLEIKNIWISVSYWATVHLLLPSLLSVDFCLVRGGVRSFGQKLTLVQIFNWKYNLKGIPFKTRGIWYPASSWNSPLMTEPFTWCDFSLPFWGHHHPPGLKCRRMKFIVNRNVKLKKKTTEALKRRMTNKRTKRMLHRFTTSKRFHL